MKTQLKQTSIEQIKQLSKTLLYAVDTIIPTDNVDGLSIISHPFALWNYVGGKDGTLFNLLKAEDAKLWREEMREKIDSCAVMQIYMMIEKPYKMAWLNLVKDYMSVADFSYYLGEAWTEVESPSMDRNVSKAKLIRWFKGADKSALMTNEELTRYENLPEIVSLYRGLGKKSERLGLSWTLRKDEAEWFRDRWGDGGKLLEVTVRKEDCLCYFSRRGEDEVIIDAAKMKDRIREI